MASNNATKLKLAFEGDSLTVTSRTPSRGVKRTLSEIDEEYERERMKIAADLPEELMDGTEVSQVRFLRELREGGGDAALAQIAAAQKRIQEISDLTQLRRAHAIIDIEAMEARFPDHALLEHLAEEITLTESTEFWDAQNFEEVSEFIASFRRRLA